MNDRKNTWALVLAAGEGSRLRLLTTTRTGTSIPKQFCSLQGGPTLLDDALRRAETVAQSERISTIVAAQHREFWQPALRSLSPAGVIVQPENRGTAHGILLALLHIAARDPDARVVILPADHHVRDEAVMTDALRESAWYATAASELVFLLGVEPDEPDPELGYIVPEDGWREGPSAVRQFVEKPSVTEALQLLERGALWNVFIMAGAVCAFLELFERRFGTTVAAMRAAIATDSAADQGAHAIASLYRQLPARDFSREVLQGQEDFLQVLPVPACGWTDLGTPKRVATTLQSLPRSRRSLAASSGAHVNLALAHAQMLRAGAAQLGV